MRRYSGIARTLTLGVAVVALAAAAACAPADELRPEDAVISTVREYNRLLVRAFAQMDMGVLKPVTTVEQAAKEYTLMVALGEGKARMVARLERIEFGPVRFSGETTASVDTTETWSYKHVSLETSETFREESGVVYRLRYTLVNDGGRWLVAEVASRDETSSGGPQAP